MSNLDRIAQITVSTASRGITRKGFGIPCVAGYHNAWADRVRTFDMASALADLVTAGIAANSPIYKAVAGLAAVSPKPTLVKIGRLSTAFTQLFEITVKAAAAINGAVFSFNLITPLTGVVVPITYTVSDVSPTAAEIATAIAALIDAAVPITATAADGVISCTAEADDKHWAVSGYDVNQLSFVDTTADDAIATDLALIQAADDTWYHLTLAGPNSKLRVVAVAAYIETQEKIFGYTSHDDDNVASNTTCIAYLLHAASYYRTYGIFTRDQVKAAAATWASRSLPYNPGSMTWAYQSLPGTTVDTLTTAEALQLETYKMNRYENVSDTPVTLNGWTAAGEWIDVIQTRDWLKVRLQERFLLLLINMAAAGKKIPYTEAGKESILTQFRAQFDEGIANGAISADEPYTIVAPNVADVSTADKIDRILPGVSASAKLAGAIHIVQVAVILEA